MPRDAVAEPAVLHGCAEELATLRALFDLIPTGVIVYEPLRGGEDFRFIYTNPALEATKPFRRMLGRTYGEAWPEIAHIALPRFRQVLETGEPWLEDALPLEVEVAPGEFGTRYYTYRVVRTDVDTRTLLFGYVSDVSNEQRAVHAIEEAHARAQHELEISNSLLRGAAELAGVTDVREAAGEAAQILLESLGHSRVSVFLIDARNQETRVITSRGRTPLPEGSGMPSVHVSDSLTADINAGRASVFDFETLAPGDRARVQAAESTLVLLAPMVQAGRLIGVIAVDDPGQRVDFSERDLEFAGGIAAQAAVAIQNARTLALQRERSARWRLLAELAEITTSPLDSRLVIEQALLAAEQRLDVAAGSVWTLGDDGAHLTLVAARGFPDQFLADYADGIDVRAPYPVAQAARGVHPVLFPVITDGVHAPVRDAYARYGIRLGSLAAMPLVARGQVIGSMTLAWDHESRFDEQHVSFLTTLAERFSVAIDTARLFEEQVAQARYAEALNRVNDIIHATLSAEEVMRRVVGEMLHVLDADAAFVQRLQAGHRELVFSTSPAHQPPMHLTAAQTPLSTMIAATGEPLAIGDIRSDPRARETILLNEDVRSVIGLPFKVRGEVVGAIIAGRLGDPRPFSTREIDFARKTAAAASLAIENAALYETQQRLADRLQEALLSLPEDVPGLSFAHEYRSATAAARVGGDFYDIFPIEDEHVGIVIGDVAGKGLEAAVLTSVVRNTIRVNAETGHATPGETVGVVNEVLFNATPAESFVTLFFGILDCDRGLLCYANAGHTTAFLKLRDEVIVPLGPTGGVVGAFPKVQAGERRVAFGANDLLVLYTDGVIEARRENEQYGEDRLSGVLSALVGNQPGEAVHAIMRDVLDFGAGQLSDDVAVLAIKRGFDERADAE